MIDARSVPQGLEQYIREAQRQKILDSLLTEIMIDAEDAALVEAARETGIDRPAAREIMPDGFLDHDPALRRGQAGSLQIATDGAVMLRRKRQVINIRLARHSREIVKIARRVRIDPAIAKSLFKALPRRIVQNLATLDERAVHQRTERRFVEIRPRGADDADPPVQQSVALKEMKRRQQHPPRQIPVAPKMISVSAVVSITVISD